MLNKERHHRVLIYACNFKKAVCKTILKYIQKKNPDTNNVSGFKKGDDLLFHKCSTIGANGLNFSVRNGKR